MGGTSTHLSQGMLRVATSSLWTSTQPKLTFLLKFTNDLPVQVSQAHCSVCNTAVVTLALGFLTDMQMPLLQGHPKLPMDLETLPEPDHLLRLLELMALSICSWPTEPHHPSPRPNIPFVKAHSGRGKGSSSQAGDTVSASSGLPAATQVSVSMCVPLWGPT